MANRKHLTEAAVARESRPTTGRKEIKDVEPGLSLRVTAAGMKSWTAVYRLARPDDPSGKRTEKKRKIIGHYPGMGVAAARERAREVLELARQGIDPDAKAAEDKAIAEQAAAERQAGSFRAVAEEYVAAMKAGELVGGRKRPVTRATAAGRESLLTRLVLPEFGDRPLAEVTAQDVSRTLGKIAKNTGPVDETLKAIRLVFKFAASRGHFHGPMPTAGLTNRQPPKKETRALADDELRAIWNAADKQGWPFGSVIRLLMLTGQRKNEVAGLRWKDVDWDRKLLILPAERVKNRAGAHEVPLTEPAMEILRKAKAACELVGNDSGLVFPSETGETPIGGWTKLKQKLVRTVHEEAAGLTKADRRALRAGGISRAETRERKAQASAKLAATPPMAHWTIHDLRHTFITRCRDGEENAEGEIVWSAPLEDLQATVNHEISSGVTAGYDHGDVQKRYRLKKRALLEWWARKLLTIVEGAPGDNVVPIRGAG